MSNSAVVDITNNTVTFDGKSYKIQALSPDTCAVLFEGVPVGRIVYTFGAANGVPDGDAISEDALYSIAEAWFAAADAS